MGKLAVPREVVIKQKQKPDNAYGTFNGKSAAAYLGTLQNRRIVNLTGSEKLMAYRRCIAEELSGKKPGNFGAVLTSFANAAHTCKSRVANIPSRKGGRLKFPFLWMQTRKPKGQGAAA
ncbi:hypothetical protein [Saccharolobus sp.]|uniref:hypothetical protein n=1 Tax=Saccharolobus sp. TaxID=2100761 RepID=UPI00317ACAB6